MLEILFIAVAAAIILIVLLAIAINKGQLLTPYRMKRLMTKHELVMYDKLNRALEGTRFAVFPQVAMGAIIDVKAGLGRSKARSYRNRFDRKIVDFVIADSQGRARILVELDDASHNAFRDHNRDRLTASAGYKTLRYKRAGSLEPLQLRRDIAQVLRAQEQAEG